MKDVCSILGRWRSKGNGDTFTHRVFILASNEWEPSEDVIEPQLLAALKTAHYKKVVADKGSSKPDRKAKVRNAIALVVGNPGSAQLVSICQTLRMLGNEPIVIADGIGAMTDEMSESLLKVGAQGVAILTIAQLLPLLSDENILAKAKSLSRK
ncbi:MAG TPA: hypothetical protein V6C89_21330 [Drouetiella sp.]